MDRTQYHPSADRSPQAITILSNDIWPLPVLRKHFALLQVTGSISAKTQTCSDVTQTPTQEVTTSSPEALLFKPRTPIELSLKKTSVSFPPAHNPDLQEGLVSVLMCPGVPQWRGSQLFVEVASYRGTFQGVLRLLSLPLPQKILGTMRTLRPAFFPRLAY